MTSIVVMTLIKSVVQESRSCLVSVSSEEQFISSSSSVSDVNVMSSCGSRTHPWRLQAPLGQRINISLLDFTERESSLQSGVSGNDACRHYGFVVEKPSKSNVSICGPGRENVDALNRREKPIYQSTTNTIEVTASSSTIGLERNFLIRVHGKL